jgi:amino acid transporter
LLGLLTPLWTIASFDSGVHISEEASNAATAVPWAIVSAVGISGILGFGINLALVFCMGTDLQALANSSQPLAMIFLNSFGLKPTLGVWSIIILVQYMIGSSLLLAGSRQIFAFSRDGALPLSGWLYRINRYTQTPVNTVWMDAFLALLLGCLVFAGSQAIDAVFALSITALYVAYSIPITARIVSRTSFKPGPFNIGILGVPVAVVAVLFMALMVIVFLFPMTPQTSVQEMNYTVAVLGGVMLLSVIWYYFPIYGGVHWFKGPVANFTVRPASVDGSQSINSNSEEKEG